MTKVLYVATSDIHLSTFHRPYMSWLSENGFQVDIVVENRGNHTFKGVANTFYLEFPRKLLAKSLFKSFKKLKKIIDTGDYKLIHCHTPIPSMLTRLAAREARKKGSKVLYTAHGFHFYKGAPLTRWLVYYTAEYILSKFTDGIITINKEDYAYIKGKMLHKKSWYIPGIGVNSKRFMPVSKTERNRIRNVYHYSNNDFIALYIAEFIPRKNHEFIIHSIKQLAYNIPNLKIVFAGKGLLLEEMKTLANSLGLSNTIEFLGFRSDVEKLCAIADLGISASKHEGLGLGLVEQMMCKVPVLATVDRGHKELIVNNYNGFLFEQNSTSQFLKHLNMLYKNEQKRLQMGENAFQKAKDFDVENSLEAMIEIYKFYLTRD